MTLNKFSLRDYQVNALNKIDADLKEKQEVLLQAIMGAGKTVTVARLINAYWFASQRDFLVLAHKQELVEQFHKTFNRMTDINLMDVGVCCAGLNEKNISRRLTIGTVQTFVNMVDNYAGCDLLVIDEAHRVSVGTDSNYDKVINALRLKRPNMRILGVTATPARLGHGYIYGDMCRPGARNLFPELNYKITYKELLKSGYLCKMRGKIAHAEILERDLSEVSVNGDYVLNQLGDVMSREIHLNTAVEAINKYCSDYHRVCVFCCTIDHAQKLRDLLGDECTIIHSQLSQMERYTNMQAWKSGKKRICTSINILAEGFDYPPLDCLVMARPTMSSSLYLQAVGRALRISPDTGKDHAFLLDLTDNTARFGTDIDNIKVTIPKAVEAVIKKESIFKLCPMCEKEVHNALRVCDCGFEWPKEDFVEADSVPELTDINIEPKKPEWYEVTEMDVMEHESRKNGKLLGKIVLRYGSNFYRPKQVNIFFCLPDYYGDGGAVFLARKKWFEMAPGSDFPETIEEFIDSSHLIIKPDRILIDESGQYPELLEMEYEEIPF